MSNTETKQDEWQLIVKAIERFWEILNNRSGDYRWSTDTITKTITLTLWHLNKGTLYSQVHQDYETAVKGFMDGYFEEFKKLTDAFGAEHFENYNYRDTFHRTVLEFFDRYSKTAKVRDPEYLYENYLTLKKEELLTLERLLELDNIHDGIIQKIHRIDEFIIIETLRENDEISLFHTALAFDSYGIYLSLTDALMAAMFGQYAKAAKVLFDKNKQEQESE